MPIFLTAILLQSIQQLTHRFLIIWLMCFLFKMLDTYMLCDWLLLEKKVYKRLHLWGRNHLFHVLFSCWCLKLHCSQLDWKFTILPWPLVSVCPISNLQIFIPSHHSSYMWPFGLWGFLRSCGFLCLTSSTSFKAMSCYVSCSVVFINTTFLKIMR